MAIPVIRLTDPRLPRSQSSSSPADLSGLFLSFGMQLELDHGIDVSLRGY